jgi:hypothetical protein
MNWYLRQTSYGLAIVQTGGGGGPPPSGAPVITNATMSLTLPLSNGGAVGTVSATNTPTSWAIVGGDFGASFPSPTPFYSIDSSGNITLTSAGAGQSPTIHALSVSATNSFGTGYGRIVVFIGSSVLSLNGSGFLQVAPTSPSGQGTGFSGAGSRILYVSNSTGSDSNTGTLASPMKTLNHACSSMRNGFPDQILLKCGDTFPADQTSNYSSVTNNGPTLTSSVGPQVFGSYGSGARPIVQVPASTNGFWGNPTGIPYGSGRLFGNNVAFIGIDWYCAVRDPSSPSYSAGSGGGDGFFYQSVPTWLWIEDCVIRWFNTGISIAGDTYSGGNPSICLIGGQVVNRRNIVHHNYNQSGGDAQGSFLDDIQFLTVAECAYDHNGWLETISPLPNTRNRNLYCGNSSQANPATVSPSTYINPPPINAWGNISTRSAQSNQFRCGGSILDNLFFDNYDKGVSLGCSYNTNSPAGSAPVIVTDFRRNVILQTQSPGPGNGLFLTYVTSSNVTVEHNIIAHCTTASCQGIEWDNNDCSGPVTTRNNIIYDVPVAYQDTTNAQVRVTGTGNAVETDNLNTAGYPHPSPTATSSTSLVDDYWASLGNTIVNAGGIDFITQCQTRSGGTWDNRYSAYGINDYIQTGFGVSYQS